MKIFYILKLIIIIFFINLSYNGFAENMKDLPYHHLADGTFRNPLKEAQKEILILNGQCQNGTKKKKN